MNLTQFGFDALEAYGFPVYNDGTEGFGREVTIVGGAVSKGEIVRACTDDSETALDASKAAGPTSWMRVCEKLAAGDSATYAHCGLFSIALEDIADDGKGRVADFGIMKATVFVTDGGMTVGAPLMPDFTNQRLVPFDGTRKCVAILATSQPDPGAAAAEVESWVAFSGVFPLANTINTTS